MLQFVTDPMPRVRSAAAFALRKMQTPEARASLLSIPAGEPCAGSVQCESGSCTNGSCSNGKCSGGGEAMVAFACAQ